MKKSLSLLILIVALTGCNSYSYKDATSEGHVVTGPAGQENIDKLELFYQKFLKHEEDKIRIVHFTDEGDPVYLDLDSNGEQIKFSRDNSDDKFGGQSKGKKRTTCNQIIKKTGQRGESQGTEYDLKDCTSDIGYSDVTNKEYFLIFIENEEN